MIEFPPVLLKNAEKLLDLCRSLRLRIATSESCTGGLLAGLLTEIPGSSDVFERGFVTYSDEAKREELGVPRKLLDRYGAVSAPVALAMAEGTLSRTPADLAVSITGIAGPDGGSREKPVGLVYLAVAAKDRGPMQSRLELAGQSRNAIREASVAEALRLLRAQALK